MVRAGRAAAGGAVRAVRPQVAAGRERRLAAERGAAAAVFLPGSTAAARGHDGGARDARAAQRPLQHAQLSAGGANGGFACPFASLTTLQAIELRYAVPAVVAALLVLGCATEARTKRAVAGEKSPAPAASVRLDYQIAALKVAVLAFSTLLATTFELLHCVDVNGARVVFRAATVECGAWQAPLYLLAAALLLPVVAGLAAAAGVGAACTSRPPDLPPVLPGKLRAPYRYGCQHWEAVLALHEPTARARAPAEEGDLRLEELRKKVVPHLAAVF